jgi:hypothetical protein
LITKTPLLKREQGFVFARYLDNNLFRRIIKYYIFFFLPVVMIFVPLQGSCGNWGKYSKYGYVVWQDNAPSEEQCKNWKDYFKEGYVAWQYDKNSIHYPKQKKNIWGIMTCPRKSI